MLAAASRPLLELDRRRATVCILGKTVCRTRLQEGEFHRPERTKELLFTSTFIAPSPNQPVFIQLGLLDVSMFARTAAARACPRLGEHIETLSKQVTPELTAQT